MSCRRTCIHNNCPYPPRGYYTQAKLKPQMFHHQSLPRGLSHTSSEFLPHFPPPFTRWQWFPTRVISLGTWSHLQTLGRQGTGRGDRHLADRSQGYSEADFGWGHSFITEGCSITFLAALLASALLGEKHCLQQTKIMPASTWKPCVPALSVSGFSDEPALAAGENLQASVTPKEYSLSCYQGLSSLTQEHASITHLKAYGPNFHSKF